VNGTNRSEYPEQTCPVRVPGCAATQRTVMGGESGPPRASLRSALADRDSADAIPGFHDANPPSLGQLALRGFGLAQLLRAQVAATRAACGIFEWVALTYLGTSSALILWFAANFLQRVRLVGTQALVALLVLVLCWKEAQVMRRQAHRESAGTTDGNADSAGSELPGRAARAPVTAAQKFWHFWRHWYPHLFFLFCFEQMGKLVRLVQPNWQDAKLIAFDQWLIGVTPSLWLERLAHPALTEFMEFSYFTYFLFLLILGGVLYYRREWSAYWAVMTYSAIGYALGYVIATVFPVQSPWFTFAGMWHADLVGGPFTALINFIEKCGRVHGAAFPSQHVAGATAALLGAWRHRRWLFWTFFPFVVCMDFSTVYVRNHYVADVLAGTVTGALGYVIGVWLIGKVGMRSRQKFAPVE
jgi:membrane-associated phospholipid phosphatase